MGWYVLDWGGGPRAAGARLDAGIRAGSDAGSGCDVPRLTARSSGAADHSGDGARRTGNAELRRCQLSPLPGPAADSVEAAGVRSADRHADGDALLQGDGGVAFGSQLGAVVTAGQAEVVGLCLDLIVDQGGQA